MRTLVASIALAGFATLAPGQSQPRFYGIFDSDAAVDITDDGLVLISDYHVGHGSAVWSFPGRFLWDEIPGEPRAFSDDGRFVVGRDSQDPYWWTRDGGGKVRIPPAGGGSHDGDALAVTADGQLVVGYSDNLSPGPEERAWRWTLFGGTADGGSLVSGGSSRAADITADGSVVVGISDSDHPLGTEAFLWSAAGGMVGIGNLGDATAVPRAISDDGSTVVGMMWSSGNRREAFIWTRDTGMVGLGDLNPSLTPHSAANDVSADGSVVVGHGRKDSGEFRAFIWTESEGMRDLNEVLVQGYGLDLGAWTVTAALAISPDGNSICGRGTYFDGNAHHSRGWAASFSLCDADLDGDGDADSADFFRYLDFFAARDGRADSDGDGVVDVGDFFMYLAAFDRGC